MAAYYNEHDKYAAQWLRNLIAAGEIAPGVVDERDIRDIRPDELLGYTQCHFFAGIGGWSKALRLAGVSDDTCVWTGSCPCQPFSAAGAGAGFADERHLWPAWFHLISQCKPPKIFGEQVASPDALKWFDLVLPDLEASGYAVGVADICAASVGAPHIRQRLWFVADATSSRSGAGLCDSGSAELGRFEPTNDCGALALADSNINRCASLPVAGIHNTQCDAESCRCADLVGNTISPRLEGHTGNVDGASGRSQPVRPTAEAGGSNRLADAERERVCAHGQGGPDCAPGTLQGIDGQRERLRTDPCASDNDHGAGPSPLNGFWRDADWLYCRDGKWRPVEPGLEPLVARLFEGMGCDSPSEISPYRAIKDAEGKSIGQAPWRVGMLRAYGNAIVPHVAAVFIEACNATNS